MTLRNDIEKKVCILGAGIMGVGLAHNFAEHGFEVTLFDKNQKALDNFKSALSESYRLQCLVGHTKASLSEIINKIHVTNEAEHTREASYVVESTTENLSNKIDLLTIMNNYLNEDSIIAINTSCIPIKALNKHIRSPKNMLGIHFMNPVPLKSMVEIIKSDVTSTETIETSIALLKSIGKNGIIVNDSPGFVINRVFMVSINEAIKTLDEGVCHSPREIDDLFINCLGHKMGPLMTADLIGLDTIVNSLEVLYDEYKNDMYKPARMLSKLVNQGYFGKKAGKGFYDYF